MTPEALLDRLRPIALAVAELDLADPAAAAAELARRFPDTSGVRAAMLEARDEGWLCPRSAGDPGQLRYGRVSKSSPDLGGCSIDAVDMTGEGARHVHPNGEANLCFATEGDPRFLGHPEGFCVYPPGSRHVPTVTGGRMVIAYFLPGGAIRFE